MRIGRVLVLCGLILAALPPLAHADGYLVPFVGANFGGEVGRPLNIALRDRNRAAIGATLGVMGGGVFGMELDMSYTHDFYPGLISGDDSGGNLVTLMPSLVLGIPVGGQRGPGIRPFVLAGAGLVRRNFGNDSLVSVSQNDFAYSLGGGVMGFFSDHFGIRGDIRYFRNFRVDDLRLGGVDFERGTFDFSRATGGVVFRF
jgi:opacity protein-like surface antigen